MSNVTLVIIFVLLAVWIAIIVSRICGAVEKCALYRCVAFYLNQSQSANKTGSSYSISDVMSSIEHTISDRKGGQNEQR